METFHDKNGKGVKKKRSLLQWFTSPYWPPIVLRAFSFFLNALLVFDFLQGGPNNVVLRIMS